MPNQDTAEEITPLFLVPDLHLEENMSKLDCVKDAPYLRFYCGVALSNKKGINIGCVYRCCRRQTKDRLQSWNMDANNIIIELARPGLLEE